MGKKFHFVSLLHFISVLIFYTEYEFGWNDPPAYSYSSTSGSAERQSTHLNKRAHQPLIPTLGNLEAPPPPVTVLPSGPLPTHSEGDKSKKETAKLVEERKDLLVYEGADFAEVVLKLNVLADQIQDNVQASE